MKPFATCACIAAILYLVLTPAPPEAPRIMLFEGADKVVHACMMGGLVLCVAFDRRRARLPLAAGPMLRAALWVMAFGVLTEQLQGALSPVRAADPLDALADWAGTLLATLAVVLFGPGDAKQVAKKFAHSKKSA